MANVESNPNDQVRKRYDLEERTALFGEAVIAFCKLIPKNEVSRPLIGQLVRSGTSIGANYCEADDAESKKDFRHKIGICKKEARETKHWLRMVAKAEPAMRDQAKPLWQEAKELNLIFAPSATTPGDVDTASFGLRHSFDIRHSSFDIDLTR